MTEKEIQQLLAVKTGAADRQNVSLVLSPDITRNAMRMKKLRHDRRQAALCALCACYGIPSEIQVRPDFSASTCRLNLESILELRPGQIIAAACRRQILRIRGKKHAASD